MDSGQPRIVKVGTSLAMEHALVAGAHSKGIDSVEGVLGHVIELDEVRVP